MICTYSNCSDERPWKIPAGRSFILFPYSTLQQTHNSQRLFSGRYGLRARTIHVHSIRRCFAVQFFRIVQIIPPSMLSASFCCHKTIISLKHLLLKATHKKTNFCYRRLLSAKSKIFNKFIYLYVTGACTMGKTCPNLTASMTSPAWTGLVWNPGLCSNRRATNRLSYGKVASCKLHHYLI